MITSTIVLIIYFQKKGKLLVPSFGGRTAAVRRLHNLPSTVRQPPMGSTRIVLYNRTNTSTKNGIGCFYLYRFLLVIYRYDAM